MTVSKFKAYGTFALIFSGFLFLGICFIICVLISVIFMGGHIIPRGTLPSFGAVGFIIVFLFLLAAIIYSWTRYAFSIKIDTNEKTIYFKNIITRQITFYSFNDFDCYLDTYANSGRGNSYKVVYLIKNRKAEKIMTGFYYTNIDELQEAVSSINTKGFNQIFRHLPEKHF